MFATRKRTGVAILIVAALCLAACAPAATPTPAVKVVEKEVVKVVTATPPPAAPLPNEIVIGVVLGMTGALAGYGAPNWEGIQLAYQEKPTVLGKPVRLVLVDDKSDRAEAALATQRLIEVEKVVAILGPENSSEAMVVAQITEKARIPALATSATNPLVTEGKQYYSRICFIDSFQGEMMAKFAIEKLGAKTAVVNLNIDSDGPVAVGTFFRKSFATLMNDPKSVLALLSSHFGDVDFTAQLTTIKALKPDVVFGAMNYNEAALMLKQAKGLGITGTIFMGSDDWQAPELIQIAGDAAEGSYYSSHYHPDAFTHPRGQQFKDMYTKKYNKPVVGWAALSFDSYGVLLDAIERANSLDGTAIAKAIRETKGFVGATGEININEKGDAIKPVVVCTIKGGQETLVGLIGP